MENQEESLVTTINHSKQLIEAATARAEAIENSAKHEAEEIKKAAKLEGLEQGRKEAVESLLGVEHLRNETLNKAKKEICELAIIIAKEVIADETEKRPASLSKRVERALKESIGAQQIKLHVNPADLESINQELTTISKQVSASSNFILVEDSTVNTACAKIETEISIIEANIDTHLEAIRSYLLKDA